MSDAVFASPDDVAARWRPLSDAETATVSVLIDDASDMIRVRWPDVDDRVTAGSLSGDSLTRVVAGMVKRAMLNGSVEGVESQSQTAGPFGVTSKFTNPNGNLFLSAEDIRLFDGGYTPRMRMGWLA